MLRSRVSTGIDMASLSEAMTRPGIDPRIWVSYGVLLGEPYIETIEGRQDVLVDVMLMPSGAEETARVGAIYAGNGFGFYCPLHTDDEVLVLAPSGDPDEGLVITQRLWSPADPPPSSLAANPEDVTLVVESGKNLRLNVQGAGNIILQVDQGKVYLGSPEDTEPAAKATSLKGYLDQVQPFFAGYSAWTPLAGDGGAALKTAVTAAYAASAQTPPSVVPVIAASTTEVK